MSRIGAITEAVAILSIVIFSFLTAGYAYELANGVLEPEWSYKGVIFSNHNVMMIFLYSMTAAGIVWFMRRRVKRKSANVIGVFTVLVAALLMACSPLFYAFIPLVVLLIIIGDVILSNKRKDRESSHDIDSAPTVERKVDKCAPFYSTGLPSCSETFPERFC